MEDINLNTTCKHIAENHNCKKCGAIVSKKTISVIPKMFKSNSEYINIIFENYFNTNSLFENYLNNRHKILADIKTAFRKVNYSDETLFLCIYYMDSVFTNIKDYSKYEMIIIGSIILASISY
jgi:hypothetical protein